MPGRHLDPADPLSTVDLTVEEIGDSAGPLAQLEHGRPAAITWHQRRAAAGEAAVSRFLMDRVEVAAAAVAEHAREASNALQRRQERLKRGGGREDDGSSSASSSSSSDSDGSRSDSDGSTGVLSRPGKDRRRRQRRAAAAAARSSLPIEGTPVRLRVGLSAWLALCTDAGLLPEHRPVRDLCLAFRAGWAVEQVARETRRTRRAAVPLLDMGGASGEKGKRRNITGALGGHGRGHAKAAASRAVADDGPPVWHLYLGPVGFRHALLILACEYLYRSYGIPCDPALTIAGTSFVGSSGGGGASIAMAAPVDGRSGPASPGAALSPTASVASNVSRAATALLLKTIVLAQPNVPAPERRRVTTELGRQAAADRGAAAGRASAAQLTPAARLAVFLSECVWPAAQRRLLLLGVSPTWEAHCIAIAVHAASAAAAVPAPVSSAAALLIPPPRAVAAGSRGLAATIVAPAPAPAATSAAPVEPPHPQQQQSDPAAQVLVAMAEAKAERRARATAMSAISLSGRELPPELMQVLVSPVLQPIGSAALQPPVDSALLDVGQSPLVQATQPPTSALALSAPPIARVAEADVISEQEQQQLMQPGPVGSASDSAISGTTGSSPAADAVIASTPPGPPVAPLPMAQAWRNSFLVAPVEATPSLLPKGEAAAASSPAEPGTSSDQSAATSKDVHAEVASVPSPPSRPPDAGGGALALLRTMERWNTFWRPRSVCNAPVLGASPLSLLSDPRIVGLLLRYESHIGAVFRAHAVNAAAPGFCRPETRSSSPAPQHDLDIVEGDPIGRLAGTANTGTAEGNVVSKANYRLGAGRYRPAPWWVNDSLPFGAPYSELMAFAATSFGEESAIAQAERAQASTALLPNPLSGGAKNKSAASPSLPPPRVGVQASSMGSTVSVALPRTDSSSAAQARTILPWAMRMQRLREQAALRFESKDGAASELVLLRMRHADFSHAISESALLPSHVLGDANGRVLLLKIFLSCAAPLPDADAAAVARGVRAVHSRLMAEYKAALDDAARTIAAARSDLADVGAGPGRNSVAYRRGTSQASMLRTAMRRTSIAVDDFTGVAADSQSSSREDGTMREGGKAASDRVASSTGAQVIFASAAAVSISLSSYAAARVRKAANDGDTSSEALRGSMKEIGLTNLSSSEAGDRSKVRDVEHLRKLDDLAAAKGKRMRRMSEAASTVLVASHIQVAASAEAAATQSHIAGSLLRSRQRSANEADSDGSDSPDNSRVYTRRRPERRASSQVASARRVSNAAVDPSSLNLSRRGSTDSSTVPSRRASQGETGSSPGSHATFPRRQRRSSTAHEDVSALARALVSSTMLSGDADRLQDDVEVILSSPSSALASATDASQLHHHASSGDDDGASKVALRPHDTASGVTAISGVNDRLDLISRRLSHADQVPDIAASMSNAEFASLKFRRQLLPPTHAISVGLAPSKPLEHRESKVSSASAAAIPSATQGNTTAARHPGGANLQFPHASQKMGGSAAFGAPPVERDIGDPTMLSGHAALFALEPQVRVCLLNGKSCLLWLLFVVDVDDWCPPRSGLLLVPIYKHYNTHSTSLEAHQFSALARFYAFPPVRRAGRDQISRHRRSLLEVLRNRKPSQMLLPSLCSGLVTCGESFWHSRSQSLYQGSSTSLQTRAPLSTRWAPML